MAASILDAFRSEDINIVAKRMTHPPPNPLATSYIHMIGINYSIKKQSIIIFWHIYPSPNSTNRVSSVPKTSLEILHLNNLWKTSLPHPPSVSCTQLHYCKALIDTNDLMEGPWDSQAAIVENQVWWVFSNILQIIKLIDTWSDRIRQDPTV